VEAVLDEAAVDELEEEVLDELEEAVVDEFEEAVVDEFEEAVLDEFEPDDSVADDDELPAWLALEELVSVAVLVAAERDVVVPVLPFGPPASPELLPVVELRVDDVDDEVSVAPCALAVEVSLLPQASAAPAPIAIERADRLENFMRPPGLATIERSRVSSIAMPVRRRRKRLVLSRGIETVRGTADVYGKHPMTVQSGQ
jgi:hypothetical protein